MKILTKRNTLFLAASFLIVSTPFASTFIDEASPRVTELTSLTTEWNKSCRTNAGWSSSGESMYCFALWQSIDFHTKGLH